MHGRDSSLRGSAGRVGGKAWPAPLSQSAVGNVLMLSPQMTVRLVTVPNVPIVSTGTYSLASGETTFSAEDLADAVQAAQDPTIPAPRIKLGHNDPRFDEAIASGELDGEPAFGTVANQRLSADGQTIIADLVDVPEWLADVLASSFPGRSIEGGFGYTASSGRTYRLVIARLALLGVTWPGITSLDDMREVLVENGQADADLEPIEAQSDSFVLARISRPGGETAAPEPRRREQRREAGVQAGIDLGVVYRQFCGDLDDGEVPRPSEDQPQADDVGPQIWWWLRSVRLEDDGSLTLIVDDDEGHLIQIPFTVQQGDLIYGDPQLVIETYVPVTADPDDSASSGQPVSARGPRTLASWPVRAARPSTQTEVTTVRLNGREVDAAALRTRLGLADDADDAAIYEALGIEPEAEPTSTETPATEPASTPAPAAEPVAARSGQDGMVLVDRETWEQTRSGAQAGAEVAAEIRTERRDRTIQAAIDDGKFPPARRTHYENLWERDPEGTRTLLTASVDAGGLAPGLVPVGRREVGGSGDGEGTDQTLEAEHEAVMARYFPNEHARLRAANGNGVRVRTEA